MDIENELDMRIPRDSCDVAITMNTGETIKGTLFIDLNSRLSDFMNEARQFIVLSDSANNQTIINKNNISKLKELKKRV